MSNVELDLAKVLWHADPMQLLECLQTEDLNAKDVEFLIATYNAKLPKCDPYDDYFPYDDYLSSKAYRVDGYPFILATEVPNRASNRFLHVPNTQDVVPEYPRVVVDPKTFLILADPLPF
jgi:hypothetical protein